MNESLKIGLGIILGFTMLGVLFFLSTGLQENNDLARVLETNNVRLGKDSSGDVYEAHIKRLPETAKQEVYFWMRDQEELETEEICDKIVLFTFSDDIDQNEKERFIPEFEVCKL